MLTLIDEYSRKCLAIPVARRPNSYDLIETVACVILWNGIPEHIRSDNGPEFVAMELQKWLASVGAKTLYITQGLPIMRAGADEAITPDVILSLGPKPHTGSVAQPQAPSGPLFLQHLHRCIGLVDLRTIGSADIPTPSNTVSPHVVGYELT